jgi:hypothetical protein
MAAGELVGGERGRGRPLPVEQAGLGEGERADADRRHPRASGHRRPHDFPDRGRHRPRGVVAAQDDDQVHAAHLVQPGAGADAQRAGVDHRVRAGHDDAVRVCRSSAR